jgi:thiamine biosynthesis lipoprotein
MQNRGLKPATLVLCSILLYLAGCSRPQLYQQQILQFGTIIDVTISTTNNPALAQQAFALLQKEFATMQAQWQVWKPSPLMEANQAIKQGKTITTTDSIIALIQAATPISRASEYLFNPAVGELIALWGFHQDNIDQQAPPSPKRIAQLVASQPTLEDLRLQDKQLSSINSSVKLDFGAFAKGYGLGLAANELRELGLENFIINAGGDLLAFGRHPSRAWKIGIRSPNSDATIGSITAKNGEAIFSSGDYERYYEQAGKKRHHIIDPRTGHPTTGAQAVTVIHHDPGLADAAATALMVANESEWLAIATAMGIDQVMRLDHDNHLHMTKNMAQRIELTRQDLTVIVHEPSN